MIFLESAGLKAAAEYGCKSANLHNGRESWTKRTVTDLLQEYLSDPRIRDLNKQNLLALRPAVRKEC
jgi:hypothetical protein